VVDYAKLRKSRGGTPEYRNQVPSEQQHSVDELMLFGNDEQVHRENPDIEAGIPEEQDGVRFVALEKAVGELAYEFYKHRADANKGPVNHPRIEVLVDTNCLLTFTGPLEHFDKEYFQNLLSQTIEGRLLLNLDKDLIKVEEEADETPYIG